MYLSNLVTIKQYAVSFQQRKSLFIKPRDNFYNPSVWHYTSHSSEVKLQITGVKHMTAQFSPDQAKNDLLLNPQFVPATTTYNTSVDVFFHT
jgi:hypothetical protein